MNLGPRHASGELVRAYASTDAELEGQAALIAQGRATAELVRKMALLAPGRGSVLICGETGTGKTLVARELHKLVAGAGVAQRVINCAALPEALLADTLWQLDDRAQDVAGEPDRASTVLLDEVGELSPWSQAVLLRKVQPNGQSSRGARFLAATHRDLVAMASAGTFSRELLVRLGVQRLNLTPLRLRRDEIAPLACHFLRLALRGANQSFVSVDPGFLACLESYDWPGNVRELNNAVVRALAVNESGMLSSSDLPDTVTASGIAMLQRDDG